MFGSRERVLVVAETESNAYEVKARAADGRDTTSTADDQPPPAFVERLPHDGGDVYFSPVLETLRAVLRKARGTLPPTTPNAQEPATEEEAA